MELKEVGILLHTLSEVRINLILKLNKDITRKKNYRLISFMNINANFPTILAN